MSRISHPAFAGLTVGCVVASLAVDLAAQTPSAKKKTAPVQQVQGFQEDPEAPRPRARQPLSDEASPKTSAAQKAAGKSTIPAQDNRQTLPEAQPFREPALSPELIRILRDWEAHSAKFNYLSGEFQRYKYDHVFEVEFRAIGKFAYSAPDKGAYQFEGAVIAKNTISKKKNAKGQPYRLDPDDTERWVCTGTEVLKIDEKTKQFERVQIPKESQGENIIDGPLPFLFGMKAEQAKRRYSFELLPENDPDLISLLVKPRLEKDSVNWSSARIKISATTYLPNAVRLTDPSGNSETVHVFTKIDVNEGNGLLKLFKRDPFKPDLSQYKPVQNEKPAAATNGARQELPGKSTKPSTTSPAGTAKARGTSGDRPNENPTRSADSSAGGAKKPSKTPPR